MHINPSIHGSQYSGTLKYDDSELLGTNPETQQVPCEKKMESIDDFLANYTHQLSSISDFIACSDESSQTQ